MWWAWELQENETDVIYYAKHAAMYKAVAPEEKRDDSDSSPSRRAGLIGNQISKSFVFAIDNNMHSYASCSSKIPTR